jgi:cardiolipin synthase/putative cardiolipin synthase
VSEVTNASVRHHSAELRSLLLDAEDEVRIAAPYFDADEEIVADIASLPNRGVETRVLTREARTNSSTSETIDRIREAVDDDARDSLEIRDLYELDAASGTQAYATHAKAIVADDRLCYLGSANLTTTSLGTNFELGVVLTGSAVGTVANLFDSVFDVSRPVD